MLKLVNLDHEMQFLDAETPLPDPWPFVYDYDDDDDDCSLACHFTTNNFTNNSQSDIISLWIILSFIIV